MIKVSNCSPPSDGEQLSNISNCQKDCRGRGGVYCSVSLSVPPQQGFTLAYLPLFALSCALNTLQRVALQGKTSVCPGFKKNLYFSLIPTGEQGFGLLSEIISLFQASR